MQSAPSQLPEKSPDENPLSSQSPIKHGLSSPNSGHHHDELQPAEPVPAGSGAQTPGATGHPPISRQIRRRNTNQSLTKSLASPASDTAIDRDSVAEDLTELSRTSSPGQRIIDYERASLASKPRKDSQASSVKTQTSSLSQLKPKAAEIFKALPPEVLTHVLSYLPSATLQHMAGVSRYYNDIVTQPHAWRMAFARLFPTSAQASSTAGELIRPDYEENNIRSEKRTFTRLSAAATWRTEYTMRTRLLRALVRGRPLIMPARDDRGQSRPVGNPQSITTYNSQISSTVTHIQAIFHPLTAKQPLRFIHGSGELGSATYSNPLNNRVEHWGLLDGTPLLQFEDGHVNEPLWGLGEGNVVAGKNCMDLSPRYGLVYGLNFGDGLPYYRAIEEQRGRFLTVGLSRRVPELGIPKRPEHAEGCSSVCIAKTAAIPSISQGLVGFLAGSSLGVLSAHSVGTDGTRDYRLGRGEVTTRWVLCPGVPIIAIAMDDAYSMRRQLDGRIWAVVLNALGEVFYMNQMPTKHSVDRRTKILGEELEKAAWETGRTAPWNFVETSVRRRQPDPYGELDKTLMHNPRSSSLIAELDVEQMVAETVAMERMMKLKPKHFRKYYTGWDMRRRMEVDFASEGERGMGESIFVLSTGVQPENPAGIIRYTRCNLASGRRSSADTQAGKLKSASPTPGRVRNRKPKIGEPGRSPSVSLPRTPTAIDANREWRVTLLEPALIKGVVTTSCLDQSTWALTTRSEDALSYAILGVSHGSASPPSPATLKPSFSDQDIPGQRARLLAIGTSNGEVALWNTRGSIPDASALVHSIPPFRVIQTDSPSVSCIGLTALYLVIGGNDGLVQSWDMLGSSPDPTRTLNSRFSTRARRRLLQASEGAVAANQIEAHLDISTNLFAAGAVVLDPDPTILRGMVSLGTHLRYWSYSSSDLDVRSGRRRKIGKGGRRSNDAMDGTGFGTFSASNRGRLQSFIASEQTDLEVTRREEGEHRAKLKGRFGVGLIGETDESMAYARMLSEESWVEEQIRRDTETVTAGGQSPDAGRRGTRTGENPYAALGQGGSSPPSGPETSDRAEALHEVPEEVDSELEEAIRRSLMDVRAKTPPILAGSSAGDRRAVARMERRNAQDDVADLEFAKQLSLAEAASRLGAGALRGLAAGGDDGEDTEEGGDSKGKGKGKGTAI